MRARAPASSANLGPGFDTLAIALDLYVQVEVEPAPSLVVQTIGEGAGLFDDASHLAVRVARQVLGHDRVAVTVRSQIPVSRGLGSSAALAVAAAAAAGAEDPFAVAAAVDGHAENAAASVFGGLVTATVVDDQPVSAHLPLSDELVFVVIIPDRSLATAEARAVLPERVTRADATFNLGRMGLLLAGLADPALLTPAATADRLHQGPRTALFPEAPALLAALVEAGALASCWSGAGPTLLGLTTQAAAAAVRKGAQDALAASGLPGHVLLLQADRRGLVYGDEAALPT
ncbi:MAG TPA: homoserine kinase [Acidimicrobiales bacterium]|jgi:homoserine kinase|nr:homoserine kinase [Acidimicrobiales bacterium]